MGNDINAWRMQIRCLIFLMNFNYRASQNRASAAEARAEVLYQENMALKNEWERKKAFLLQ